MTTTDMGRKLGGCAPLGEDCDPFGGGAGSQSNNVAGAERHLHAKFRLDPSYRLATIHQRHKTGQDRQRSDSIGRTVFQRDAQKQSNNVKYNGPKLLLR